MGTIEFSATNLVKAQEVMKSLNENGMSCRVSINSLDGGITMSVGTYWTDSAGNKHSVRSRKSVLKQVYRVGRNEGYRLAMKQLALYGSTTLLQSFPLDLA